jgi:hypothetical protein
MSEQKTQNYANHRRYVPGYHYFLTLLVTVTLVCSGIYFGKALMASSGRYVAALIFCLAVIGLFSWFYMRAFAIKAQDRAIRAEENFRHYVLAGKQLDSRLRMGQIVALRFASDEEFVALAAKAVAENVKPDDIKKAIKTWRPDNHRA